MFFDQILNFCDILVWPVTIITIVLLLKNALTNAIARLKGVEGPAGWKLLFEVKKVEKRLRNVEELTINLYNLSGEHALIRDEIYQYVADILGKVSRQTAFEMRKELNLYHINNLGKPVEYFKKLLSELGLYIGGGGSNFSEEIDDEFIESILRFQKNMKMKDADGVIGPKTYRLLLKQFG